jgi:transcriptional regulator with XRE-family HTH domain
MASDQQVMRLWRLRQKLSLEAAAEKSGMDSKTAWKYLRDRRLPSEMRQIVLPEKVALPCRVDLFSRQCKC